MYHPVGNHNGQEARPAHLENVEFDTRYDPGTLRYSPQPVQPPDNASKHDDETKSSFKSTTKEEPAIINNWPAAAQQVANLTLLRSSLMIFDTILASTPIMFIALALIAARLDGKEVSNYGAGLAETLLLSPTIFPVIFAALMGRFFKHLGVYLAERGTTLGRLEQLVGCQSVFTALERQITLRSWSIVGLLSIFIWLLSPVGGQSALRLIGEESKTVSSVSTVRFLDPLNLLNSHMETASSMNSGRATFTSIFFAALLSSSKFANSSMDLWGNVKIPLYRHLVNTSTTEWKDVVGKDGYNATYGSLIGVPLAGMPSKGASNFSIRARQFDVQCSKNEMRSGGKNDTLWQGLKSTWGMKNANGNFSQTFFREHPRPIYSISLVEDRGYRSNFSVATCALDFIYVEAKVNCNGISCAVTSMRKLPLLEDGYTLQEDTFLRGYLIYNSMIGLPTVDNILVGSPDARGATNAEKWMMNPDDFIGTTYQNVALYKLDPELFATRLTIMWNTFYQSTFATIAIGGSLPKNLTQTGVIQGKFSSTSVTFNATQAAVVEPVGRVYKTNWKWFAALLASSIILLVAAYIGLVLKYITLAPDIIGYASSLTMLNPYCPTPSGGTTLHGLERTALLHDMPIRIGDVCPNDSVGAIALAKTDDVNVARLDRQRWYI